jgi:uncharacterized protein
MLTLTHINIYPVKSLDGYSPTSAIVERRGLQYDRRWLITDMDGMFMTQRTNAKMALLRATIEDNTLIIKEKQNEQNSIKIPLNTEGGEKSDVVVWDDTMSATPISEAANAWLSDFLQKKCQLVYMPDTTKRQVEAKYNRGEDIVSFADGYPFLMIGEASMADLNSRMDTPLSIRRFRANFIFSGGTPFQEDTFAHFHIGDVPFEGVKPCARCVLTTRDPDTGIKGKEPLATLTSYRQQGTKILFGQNVIWNFKKWDKAVLPIVRMGDVISL